jgi:hypothetical protein
VYIFIALNRRKNSAGRLYGRKLTRAESYFSITEKADRYLELPWGSGAIRFARGTTGVQRDVNPVGRTEKVAA